MYKYTFVPQGLVTASPVFNAVASMAIGHLKHLHTIVVDDIVVCAAIVPGSTDEEAFGRGTFRRC